MSNWWAWNHWLRWFVCLKGPHSKINRFYCYNRGHKFPDRPFTKADLIYVLWVCRCSANISSSSIIPYFVGSSRSLPLSSSLKASQFVFHGVLLLSTSSWSRASQYMSCLWSERDSSSDTFQPLTLQPSAPEQSVKSSTFILIFVRKVVVLPRF